MGIVRWWAPVQRTFTHTLCAGHTGLATNQRDARTSRYDRPGHKLSFDLEAGSATPSYVR
jgi:hypothetical protein